MGEAQFLFVSSVPNKERTRISSKVPAQEDLSFSRVKLIDLFSTCHCNRKKKTIESPNFIDC